MAANQTMLDTALAHHGQGRLREAEQLYRQILADDPGNADGLHLLGMIAHQSGDSETAVALIRQAIAIKPNAASYHANLGNVLQHQGYARDAAASYLRALRIKPGLAEVHVNLGNVFLAAKDFASAVTWYERALALNAAIPEAHKNLGDAYVMQEKPGLAIAAYERALKLSPEYVDAMIELGSLLRATGDLHGALMHLKRAREIRPENATAVFREALVRLLLGDWAAGWSCYEERWRSPDHATPMRENPQPFWQGERLAAGRLLLWPEQGVGDEIMFAGLIPDVLRTGSLCILECDTRLEPLFRRSFSLLPGIEVTSDRSAAIDPAREIAAQLPIGSLSRLFRGDRSAFASSSFAYLKAEPAKTAEFRGRYGEEAPPDCLRVGIAWRSNNVKTGPARSVELETLMPLFGLHGVRWISLQYGALEELKEEAALAKAPVLVDPHVDQLADIDSFAAQIAALDLVVTIDNTTAHLAGALGVPVWVLLPFAPDWRWLREGDGSPWYPSMRLFRQPTRGDWGFVVRTAAEALAEFVRSGAAARR
jgi:tetratricopeptide (TPR) repeat protein